jgi:hypothetical protein
LHHGCKIKFNRSDTIVVERRHDQRRAPQLTQEVIDAPQLRLLQTIQRQLSDNDIHSPLPRSSRCA